MPTAPSRGLISGRAFVCLKDSITEWRRQMKGMSRKVGVSKEGDEVEGVKSKENG